MKALVLGPDGPAVVERSWIGRSGEARVRVSLAGVCATDLELVRGYMAFSGVLGHEWIGVVEASPDPDQVGRRVTGDINVPCRVCATCRASRPTHCPSRTVLGIVGRDGAFAELLTLPPENLHVVPDGIPDDVAVFVEPLAAACEILEQVHVRPSDRVVVLGVGRLGQLCARVLALTGADVIGAGRDQRRLDLLPSPIRALQVDDVLPGADLVVDCTGSNAGFARAQALVRPRGTLVLKTTVHAPGSVDRNRVVIDEITVVGSRCGPFAPALRLLASGLVDPRPLIGATFALRDGVRALEAAARPEMTKVLIDPRGS